MLPLYSQDKLKINDFFNYGLRDKFKFKINIFKCNKRYNTTFYRKLNLTVWS